MEQILAHLIGDYILQNNWMANTKTKNSLKGYVACLLHVILYTFAFVFITSNVWHLFLIAITHFFIDKYRLAVYWIKLVNWNWKSTNNGFPNKTPAFMSIWLMIIIDNVFHLLINYTILSFI
jgi:hypothetical protein